MSYTIEEMTAEVNKHMAEGLDKLIRAREKWIDEELQKKGLTRETAMVIPIAGRLYVLPRL